MIRLPASLLVVAGLVVVTAPVPGQTPASRAYLLNVGQGQTFSDIGSDNQTKPEIVADFKELGGKAIKVSFFKATRSAIASPRSRTGSPSPPYASTSSTPARTRPSSD
jgi:hypothetical protein